MIASLRCPSTASPQTVIPSPSGPLRAIESVILRTAPVRSTSLAVPIKPAIPHIKQLQGVRHRATPPDNLHQGLLSIEKAHRHSLDRGHLESSRQKT